MRRVSELKISLKKNLKPFLLLFRFTVLHEFIHLLGFHHIHISPNRDNHIRIIWENINPPYESRFMKRSESDELSDFGTGYDYDSIMHTNSVAYSVNGERTIETLDPENQHKIGQRERLSAGDILRINRMYKCDENVNLEK